MSMNGNPEHIAEHLSFNPFGPQDKMHWLQNSGPHEMVIFEPELVVLGDGTRLQGFPRDDWKLFWRCEACDHIFDWKINPLGWICPKCLTDLSAEGSKAPHPVDTNWFIAQHWNNDTDEMCDQTGCSFVDCIAKVMGVCDYVPECPECGRADVTVIEIKDELAPNFALSIEHRYGRSI